MKSIRIFVNGIELPHVREDAKIRDENSSFSLEIKAQHNTRPIRIKENEETIKALGPFEIVSAGKKKYFPCKVVIGAIRYNGILTQLDKIPGFRKCNVKFGSDVNEIMDKKIGSFFPSFSVINDPYAQPYREEAEEEYGHQQAWVDHVNDVAGKIYPEAKWQFPEVRYRDKFGTDLNNEDPHFFFRGHLNSRDVNGLVKNTVVSNANYFSVHNNNVVVPMVFWLSPIFYAFQSIGYKLSGRVPEHPFFKRLLHISKNDNMVKIPRKPPGEPLAIDLVPWTQEGIAGVLDGLPFYTYVKKVEFTPPNPGEYEIGYDMDISIVDNNQNFYGVQVAKEGRGLLATSSGVYGGRFEGRLRFTVEEGEQNTVFVFYYYSMKRVQPTDFEIGWYQDLSELDFYDMHPTIDFSRYIPNWTVADYLNNYQKQFNFKIDIDDIEKTISINFNEEDYLLNGKIIPIFKSLNISKIKNIEEETYYLKYANNMDLGQFVAQDIEATRDEKTKEIVTDFKYIPFAQNRNVLSQKTEDKEGEGLLIYDPASHPATVHSYSGINLQMPGLGGIFQTFHKRWLLFRINAANVVLKGPFSKTELFQISKHKKLLIDNQLWMVKAIEYQEDSQALFDTEIEVEAVTF